ncbi:MAG: polyprenol monophosphomannose synthase [Candidatus Dormibacteria bacterium]
MTLGEGALVIVPTYNEIANLPELLPQILEQLPAATVLVVDDGSPDGTGAMVAEFATREPRVHLLERSRKLGLGTAYVAGFRRALDDRMRMAITMDADFSHHPQYLPSLVGAIDAGGAAMAIGSRYIPGGGTRGWNLRRRLLSKGANTFARTALRLHTHDCTGGFRCYSRPVLEGLNLDQVFSHGYSALIELLWRCERANFEIAEVPIIFHDRLGGVSKISRGEIYRGVTTVLRLAFRSAG